MRLGFAKQRELSDNGRGDAYHCQLHKEPMKATPFFLLLALGLSGFPTAHSAETKPVPPTPPCCREPLPPAKYSDRSVYGIEATWISDLGKSVKLDVLRGRPVVLAMFFTKCQHSCPILVRDMKELEGLLPRAVRERTDFVLVSIDPKNDSVEALRAYRDKQGLNAEHWMLLRGEQSNVDALAEHIGFKYIPGSEFQFGHSVMITVLNPTGEIVFQQAGLGVDRREAAKTLERLATAAPKRAKPKR
jgi:protein SCO1